MLEVLVVLVLIGIAVGFAVLSLGDRIREDTLEQEAQRLTSLMQLASEEAVLQYQDLGLFLHDNQYRFLQFAGDGWRELDDDILRQRELPDHVELELLVEGTPAEPPENEDEIVPQVMLLSSGEITPFEVRMTMPELVVQYVLTGSANGKLQLERVAAQR